MSTSKKKGAPVMCQHAGCWRRAVRVVSQPDHREFHGQTHNCCALHSQKSRVLGRRRR